ncbi:MAG: YceH family protein [Pirellula sp.]|nr:YceH family protein [Pirellula sp.]
MDEIEMDSTEEGATPPTVSASQIVSVPQLSAEPQWKPLTAKQRRVLGTLMEKSKTTPDAYPMTFSGLTTGCNQKSNREPVTNYSVEQVEAVVDELRSLGAVTIVQGSGRVTKVRHYAYNWMVLNKTEAAIMTELLLRGEQTLGELRTRASRMEPIDDLKHLQQLFDDLKGRNLVVELSPPGRGQLVTHNLYPEWELDQLKGKSANVAASPSMDSEDSVPAIHTRSVGPSKVNEELEQLKKTVESLATRLAHIESELGIKAT